MPINFLKNSLKNIRITLRSTYYAKLNGVIKNIIPKPYINEIMYFENLKGHNWNDDKYLQGKLRSSAHQIDKALHCNNVKNVGFYAEQTENLLTRLKGSSVEKGVSFKWANDVLTKYYENREGSVFKEGLNKYPDELIDKMRSSIKDRRSIRSFSGEKINDEILNDVLEAGLWAPSGCNRQNISYFIIDDKNEIKDCQKYAGEKNDFPQHASHFVVILVDCRCLAIPNHRHMAYLEAGASIQNILLMSLFHGIGTCWLFWSSHEKNDEFLKKYKLPKWLLPVSVVCLGLSNDIPVLTPARKELCSSVYRWIK